MTSFPSPAPDPAQVLALAMQLHQRGDLQQAAAHYRWILARAPAHLDALYLLALAELGGNRPAQAAALLAHVTRLAPGDARAYFALGNAEQAQGQPERALVSYDTAIALKPDYQEAHYNRATTLQALARNEEAVAAHDRALALQPGDVEALINRGIALQQLRRHAEALASYDAALRIAPGDAKAHYNRGAALQGLQRPAEALQALDAALAVRPGYVEAQLNRGAMLMELDRPTEAQACYEAVLARDPASPKARFNLALALLLDGRYTQAWPLHEARWQALNLEDGRTRFDRPLWLGKQDLRGRTLLIHAEQGYGDTLQFCRYAALAVARGARVLLEVQPPLKRLLAQLPGVQVLARGEPLPPFDCHCPLLSMPLACATELAGIPAVPAYLRAEPALAQRWRDRLGEHAGLRVGLAWSGNPAHGNDHNRSLALARFAALAALDPRLQLVSVQKEVRQADLPALTGLPNLLHAGAELGDFADTAGLLANLDLLVSVDTSVAHLAGAMGKPVWVLLPHVPDWRWLRGRADSPWYPSATLLRQARRGDWDPVLSQLQEKLAELVSKK